MILKVGMDHQGHRVYKFALSDDIKLTLTYFMTWSNLVKIAYWANNRHSCQVGIYRTSRSSVFFIIWRHHGRDKRPVLSNRLYRRNFLKRMQING